MREIMRRTWAVVGTLLLGLVLSLSTWAVAAESQRFQFQGRKDTPQATGTATPCRVGKTPILLQTCERSPCERRTHDDQPRRPLPEGQ
jgi:hypothetical protein